MSTINMISSRKARSRSVKHALRDNARYCKPTGKRMRPLTRAELAALFGVPPSELGRLGRHGVFRRVGADRYLLDYRRSASLLSEPDRPFLTGAAQWVQRTAIFALPRGQEPGSQLHAISEELAEFYWLHGGFLENRVNILKVPDLRYATVAAGMFLTGGLQDNERVAVVSFEHPDPLFSRLAEAGLALDDALQTEQLIYLYYKPDVAHSLSLSVDYRELFREVALLGGDEVRRLVLFNVDALINTNSEHLVHTSLHHLIYAANHFQVTLLGLFVAAGQEGERLDEGCRAVLPGYFVMS